MIINPRPVDDTPVNAETAKGVTSNWAYNHNADLDAHMADFYQQREVGQYHSLPGKFSGTTDVQVANRFSTLPFFTPRTITVDRIAVHVTTADAGKSIRLGIYEDTDFNPVDLLLDAGEISAGATGVIAATIDQVLTKGNWWLVCVSDGTPTLRGFDRGNTPLTRMGIMTASAFDYTYVRKYVDDSYGALSATFPAGIALATGTGPLIAVRIASLD